MTLMTTVTHEIDVPVTVAYEVDGTGPTAIVSVRFMGQRRTTQLGKLPHQAAARMLLSEILRQNNVLNASFQDQVNVQPPRR